jgi:hypothetical protein
VQSLRDGRVDGVACWNIVQIKMSNLLVMGDGMVLGVIIREVSFSWCPINVELFLLDSVAYPVESHVDSARSLLLDVVIGDATRCRIVGLDRCWWLWVAHFFERGS